MPTSPKDLNILFSLAKDKRRVRTAFHKEHCRLRKHMHKIGMSSGKTCRFCELKSETSAHVLLECDAVTRSRLTHLGIMHRSKATLNSSIPQAY